jgi:hypothetical protein
MKYYNLVFINHSDKEKNYLFQVPLAIRLKAGEKVFADTTQGEVMGDCVTDSFIVDEYTAEQIIIGAGAYKPLKYVIGWAKKQDGYKCIDFRLVDVPF